MVQQSADAVSPDQKPSFCRVCQGAIDSSNHKCVQANACPWNNGFGMTCAFCQHFCSYRVVFSVTVFGEQELSSSSLTTLLCFLRGSVALAAVLWSCTKAGGNGSDSRPCNCDVPAGQQRCEFDFLLLEELFLGLLVLARLVFWKYWVKMRF